MCKIVRALFLHLEVKVKVKVKVKVQVVKRVGVQKRKLKTVDLVIDVDSLGRICVQGSDPVVFPF